MELSRRLEILRQDVLMVLRGLRGQSAPSFTERAPLARHKLSPETKPAALLIAPRHLRVLRVVRETKDATSLWLADPQGKRIHFEPGQFFTVLVKLPNGETLRRAYSISSLPDADGAAAEVRITIKRLHKGRASNHINDSIREGDTIEVLGPSGSFTVGPKADNERLAVLLAGGSGITPLASIARTLLVQEPKSQVALIFGNRGKDDIIYRDELNALASEFQGRFTLRHVLSELSEGFAATTGILDKETVARELAALSNLDLGSAEYYLCGPEPMMAAVHEALGARGVNAARIREERFQAPARRNAPILPTKPEPVLIRLRGKPEREVIAAPSQTILEAGLAASLPMPFSCTMGGCGACKVKLVSGHVESEEPNCLSNEEKQAGFVLACVSRPSSACVVEVP